ncbi:hypothetical protein IU418_26405 [Nocardia farcinica]|uniref:hypothetical protein n=1 Tax=Nocardia farcinica TaxID=37329 RepID=UPI0009C6273E|nr:hypothetical protein [Nocardia farcinica]MBF6540743.1 hypothetical protein [Nocardia farcinica]SLG33137.1 Uncharacterised protein [Mycobacteroides abscessus subsp. abscessus]
MKHPTPYTNAPCTQPAVFERSRQTHTHPWDYYIPAETPAQQRARHTRIVRLCQTCPALTHCQEKRERVLRGIDRNPWTGERIHIQGVIWAGRIHPDKEPGPDVQDALLTREDMAA